MKNKRTKILAIIIAFALMLALAVSTLGATDNDPLVTLSYINETVIPKITEDVKNAVLAVLNANYGATPEETPTETPTEQPSEEPEQETPAEVPAAKEIDLSSVKYNVVLLKQGEKLFATGDITESTEIILRSGVVTAISPFGDQGIADLTASKELYNNDPLVKNNYCLIPRGSDGRGICAENGDAYILVRGEYEIVQ